MEDAGGEHGASMKRCTSSFDGIWGIPIEETNPNMLVFEQALSSSSGPKTIPYFRGISDHHLVYFLYL